MPSVKRWSLIWPVLVWVVFLWTGKLLGFDASLNLDPPSK